MDIKMGIIEAGTTKGESEGEPGLKNYLLGLGVVAHACNPSTLGG